LEATAMFKTIVVGTDGSDSAFEAVKAAAELAETQGDGAVLHVVSVVKPMANAAVAAGDTAFAAPSAANVNWEEEIRVDLEGKLAGIADHVRKEGVKVETHVRFGSPADVLCEMATHIHADVIVVGNRGMQGGRRLLGSVPNTVSHHAPCSVLIIATS
jgi:nucleotide-binding universal stress UspA family protein